VAWAYVQSNSKVVASGNPGVAYTTNLSSGTKLIAALSLSSSESGDVALDLVATVSDGTNGFTFLGGMNNTDSAVGCVLLFGLTTPSGDVGTKPTITATINASVNNFGCALIIQEISGLSSSNTTSMIDGTPGTNQSGGSATATTGTYSSSVTNEYLLVLYGDPGSGDSIGTPSGYTPDPNNPASSSDAQVALFYKNSTGGSESASMTLGGSTQWETTIVAFELGSGPAATIQTLSAGRPPVVLSGFSGRAGAQHSR
jgi:hypothetical protein